MKRANKLQQQRVGRKWHLKKLNFVIAFLTELESDIKNEYPEKELTENIEKLSVIFDRIQTRLKTGIF